MSRQEVGGCAADDTATWIRERSVKSEKTNKEDQERWESRRTDDDDVALFWRIGHFGEGSGRREECSEGSQTCWMLQDDQY